MKNPQQTASPTPKQMPAKSAASAKSRTANPTAPAAELVPASQFRRYPTNRIIDAESIENMSVSIREVEILQPIIARRVAGESVLEIIAGETRWLGACKIDPEYPVPVFIRDLSDKEASQIHAVENFQRTELNAIEEGREIRHMLACGWKMDEIKDAIGKGKDYLYRRLKLLNLPTQAQTSFLEGALSLQTAEKILSLPEEVQGKALQAVMSPAHFSGGPLPQRQALNLIEREFIAPARKAEEWSQRRHALRELYPAAEWLEYAEACKIAHYTSGYIRADQRPDFEDLSDAARFEEIGVPTWGELAAKHGAKLVIGCGDGDEAFYYVLQVPLMDAEKIACRGQAKECIFSHEGSDQSRRLEKEKLKRELKAHKQALAAEKAQLANLIISPGGLPQRLHGRLVEFIFEDCFCGNNGRATLEDFAILLGEERKRGDQEANLQRYRAAVIRYLRSKAFSPLEALARLQMAYYLKHSAKAAITIFETRICKPANYPAHWSVYQENLARERQQVPAENSEGATGGEEAA